MQKMNQVCCDISKFIYFQPVYVLGAAYADL